MKKTLLLLFILTGLFSYAQVVAMPDTFTVLQANVDTFDLVQNDTFPAGDSVCITLLDSNARFTLLDCRRVVYEADSFHLGFDSVQYVICDTAMVCDTGIISLTIDSNRALLPVAGFTQVYLSGQNSIEQKLFDCGFNHPWGMSTYELVSTSINADSISWSISNIDLGSPLYGATRYFSTDTIQFTPMTIFGFSYQFQTMQVCITSINSFGTNIFCDTTCSVYYEGINEISLSHINIYPAPADARISIDMSQNTDAITSQYSAIDLINMLGQKVKNISRTGNSKTVQINVADLPEGIYNATITDAMGETRMLGRFTIER